MVVLRGNCDILLGIGINVCDTIFSLMYTNIYSYKYHNRIKFLISYLTHLFSSSSFFRSLSSPIIELGFRYSMRAVDSLSFNFFVLFRLPWLS